VKAMPLLTDGDITEGFIRERKLIKKIYELTFTSRSKVFKGYVEGISRVTGLPKEVVAESRPVKNFLKRLIG